MYPHLIVQNTKWNMLEDVQKYSIPGRTCPNKGKPVYEWRLIFPQTCAAEVSRAAVSGHLPAEQVSRRAKAFRNSQLHISQQLPQNCEGFILF